MTSLSKSRAAAWMAWIIVSVFYAYQYIIRVMPSVMMVDIKERFGMDDASFGQFSGIYYIGYSLAHIPIGIMLDRFGPRKVMSWSLVLMVLGLMPLLYTNHEMFPIVGKLLIGLGSSAAVLGIFKIVRMGFAEGQFSRMVSFAVTIGLVGAIYGGGPMSLILNKFGYNIVVKTFAMIGLVLAAVTYLLVPNVKRVSEASILSDIKEVVGNQRVIWACVFAGLMIGPLEGFADVWGKVFLEEVYKIHGTLAASLPSIIFIGMCFGGPLLSIIAERVQNYMLTVIAAGVVMILGFGVLLVWHVPSMLIMINFALIGIACGYQILVIYKASTYTRGELAGLTTAFANMIIMIFGYVFHTIIGTVIDSLGGAENIRALAFGITVIPAGLFLGTIGFAIKYKSLNKKLVG